MADKDDKDHDDKDRDDKDRDDKDRDHKSDPDVVGDAHSQGNDKDHAGGNQTLKVVQKHDHDGDRNVCMSKNACEVIGLGLEMGTLKFKRSDDSDMSSANHSHFKEAEEGECHEKISDNDVDHMIGHRDDDDQDRDNQDNDHRDNDDDRGEQHNVAKN